MFGWLSFRRARGPWTKSSTKSLFLRCSGEITLSATTRCRSDLLGLLDRAHAPRPTRSRSCSRRRAVPRAGRRRGDVVEEAEEGLPHLDQGRGGEERPPSPAVVVEACRSASRVLQPPAVRAGLDLEVHPRRLVCGAGGRPTCRARG